MVNWFPCTYGGGRNLVKRGHLEIEFSECPDLQAVWTSQIWPNNIWTEIELCWSSQATNYHMSHPAVYHMSHPAVLYTLWQWLPLPLSPHVMSPPPLSLPLPALWCDNNNNNDMMITSSLWLSLWPCALALALPHLRCDNNDNDCDNKTTAIVTPMHLAVLDLDLDLTLAFSSPQPPPMMTTITTWSSHRRDLHRYG